MAPKSVLNVPRTWLINRTLTVSVCHYRPRADPLGHLLLAGECLYIGQSLLTPGSKRRFMHWQLCGATAPLGRTGESTDPLAPQAVLRYEYPDRLLSTLLPMAACVVGGRASCAGSMLARKRCGSTIAPTHDKRVFPALSEVVLRTTCGAAQVAMTASKAPTSGRLASRVLLLRAIPGKVSR